MLNQTKGNMYSFITHTWNTVKGECPHLCEYCLSGETEILMSDFSTKQIRDVKTDDKIVGISKEGGVGFYKFGEHAVVNVGKRLSKTIIIQTTHGEIECTKDHPLMGSTEARNCTDWKHAGAFSVYENLRFIGVPSVETHTRDIGWVSGFCDGDGCFFKHGAGRKHLGFEAVCVDDALRNEFLLRCKKLGVNLRNSVKKSSQKSFNHGGTNPMVCTRSTPIAKKLKQIIKFRDDHHDNFYAGYLAGMLDTDGSVSKYIRIAQSRKVNREKYNRIIFCCKKLGFKYREEEKGIRILGGFKNRVKFLFHGKPKHSKKSINLLYGYGTKGSHHSQINNIKIGRKREVYNIETTSGNYVANGFIVHNCYMKKWGEQKPVRFDEKELKTDLGTGNFIFVGSSCDMWADDIPVAWIGKTLRHCSVHPENKYLFQTKNPERIYRYRVSLPEKSIIGTTVESNRWYKEMGNAPHPIVRASVLALKQIRMFETMLTIEPVMDFDIDFMVEMVKAVEPNWVNIGANTNSKIKLPEPSPEKINGLIKRLRNITEVKIKPNLNRLMPKYCGG